MPKASPPPTTSSSNLKRRVRISESDPTVMHRETTDLSDQERSDSWWSATDFAAVKDSVKRICRDHRRVRRYSDCLTDAYQSACTMASLVDDGLTTTTMTAPPPPTEQQPQDGGTHHHRPNEGLVRWLENEGPRGLEVYSSRLHAMRRQRHLQDSKHAVFLEQARQHFSNERDDETLARQAAHASRRARTFATLLGHADAWAAASTGEEPKKLRASPSEEENPNEITEDSSGELSEESALSDESKAAKKSTLSSAAPEEEEEES